MAFRRKRVILMQEFAIALGAKRTAKTWKTEQWSLEAFVARLAEPKVTAETMAEYATMDKDERDARKDVGGYVAGALKDKSRGTGQVQWRSMVTLDLDNVDVKEALALATVAERCPYYYILHPTHSHRPTVPRLRLIIPLETNVSEEQYEPIARRIAADINMDWFDPTTFQASRLMYWPSVPIDLDYAAAFVVHEGPLCVGAEVLARYTDWRNIGEWPGMAQEEDQLQHRAKTQQDPREKHGPVGAFCRAYSIAEVIAAYLPDVYTPTEKANRYTYAAGSTVGGLVLYDDVFAYDNHATSPASGMLCNAFDLVRVHRFGAEDAGSRVRDPQKLPSYQAMLALIDDDARVQAQRAKDLQERQAAVEDEFDYDEAEDEKSLNELLKYDKNGLVAKTINNVFLILTHDPAFKGKMYSDTFAGRDVLTDELPWSSDADAGVIRDWSDADTAQLRRYLEVHYDGLTSKDVIETGLTNAFQANRRHPVRDYLAGLPLWDGVERVADLLIDYLGASDTDYTRAVTKTHIVAAVARVMEPGVKYDTMITLSGKQGIGKSTFIRILCGDAWFNDSLRDFKGKDPFELIQGSWMVEIGELAAYRKSDKEEFKAFLSKTADKYRPPYGHRTTMQPRQCIFWGTTNDAQFLRDVTGERRTWPVAVGVRPAVKDVFEQLAEERDQIWAEALDAYRKGWPLVLSAAMEKAADEVRGIFTEEDARVYAIEEYLEKELPLDWKDMSLIDRCSWIEDYELRPKGAKTAPRDQVTALEVWCECFHGSMNDFPKRDNGEINNILNNIPGWECGERVRLGMAYEGRRPKISFVRKR